jgi:hypothetical protein
MHFGLTVRIDQFYEEFISSNFKPTLQGRVQVATQFLHSVLHPVQHKRDKRHPKGNVMTYRSEDHLETSGQPHSGDGDSDCESALTPLPSDDEEEEEHTALDIGEIKASVALLQQYVKAMLILELKEPQQDFIRPGVQDGNEYSFERTGVTHLVHAWHAQAHERPMVGYCCSS